jgi:hypothetical protein
LLFSMCQTKGNKPMTTRQKLKISWAGVIPGGYYRGASLHRVPRMGGGDP